MKKILLFLSLIPLTLTALHSQDISADHGGNLAGNLHLEAGYIYPDNKIRESIAIRQNISSYYVNQYSNGQVSSETYGFTFGARWEYFYTRWNAGLSAGLRYTGFRTKITGFSAEKSDFFYLRYSMSGTSTKFARIRNLSESNDYLSIPVELTFIPLRYHNFGFFARAGAEFGIFAIQKKTGIDFREPSMDQYEDEILNNITSHPGNYYSTLYGSLGVFLGKENKPHYFFEILIPSLFLSKNNFALTEPGNYTGFKFSVQLPVIQPK